MMFYHPYYVKQIQEDRERQIMQMHLINELRRARKTQKAQKNQKAISTGRSLLGLRRRPAPAK